ncbi:MAG TPA: ferredoxin family protein [Polyangiaceae bacterium]
MAYVVTDNCNGCRFTDCVAVCPVDCIHGDGLMVYIDPEECIDCGVCAGECPVDAIYPLGELPEELKSWAAVNAERSLRLPVLKDPEVPAAGWLDHKKKLGF